MQTFRDCERQLDVDYTNQGSTCAAPQIFADYLCGVGPHASPQMVQGASPAMIFGGAYLHLRYDAAVLAINSNMPCSHPISVTSAIVKLPLLQDMVTPAYLPNLIIARSQLSVVDATESDTDEDILWWDSRQLDLTNLACTIDGAACQEFAAPVCNTCGCFNLSADLVGATGALYGRTPDITIRLKSRRRLKEREALFFLTTFNNGGLNDFVQNWPIRRNLYIRYAVRPGRG